MDQVVGCLLKLIPLAWEKLQNELALGSSAEGEFHDLKGSIEKVGKLLEEAYSKEVIDEQLKEDIKRMQKFLYDSEDAVDDFCRRESRCQWECLASYFFDHYNNRTFTVKAKELKKMRSNYPNDAGIIPPQRPIDQSTNSHAHSSSVNDQSSSIAFFEETNALVGITGPMKRLVEWLEDKSSMSKGIFVHGMQGVGKSSLVASVLRNQTLKSCFKYWVWIEDLRSYELRKVGKKMLMSANATMWDFTEQDKQGKQVKLKKAFSLVRKNRDRWALVLDDLGSMHVLDSLFAHIYQTRPSVLVTTRISSLENDLESFFTYSLNTPGLQPGDAHPEFPLYSHSFHFINFNSKPRPKPPKWSYDFHRHKHVFLSSEDSLILFCQKMFNVTRCPSYLEEASKSILKKLEGLPLAILATCKLLRNERNSVTGAPDSAEWERLSGRLGEELLSKAHTGDPIQRMVTLRMDPLFNVRCLFYLSIFPLDCPIRCSTMMRLWMAERFIEQDPIKKNAENTLKMLLEHHVIQEKKKTNYGRVVTCRVHNLLHQIIISKSKDVGHAGIVANPEENLPANVWRLSFHCDMKDDYKGTSVKQLRSLLIFRKVFPDSMKKLLGQAKRLRVLHLQRHLTKEEEDNFLPYLNSLPKEILRLKYLRYLSLRDTNVQRIDGIGALANLETLDLKGTNVSELPDDILELKVLCHLLVYRSNKSPAAGSNPKLGVKAPSALGFLTSLHKLCMVELNPVKRSILGGKQWKREQLLEKLGKLTNLRRLGISMLRSEDVGLLCSSIEKLTQLVALHLIAAEGQILDLSNGNRRTELKFLQRVHLTGCLGTWPDWILSPTILVKLVLKRSQLNPDQFQRLGELQSLKHLELEQAFNEVSEMMFWASGFQKLCFLGLHTFDNLTSINVEEGALPALERLFIGRCKSLIAVPQVITSPKELKCLEHYDMPKEFMIAVEMNEDCKHLKVKRKVWEDGAIEDFQKPPQASQESLPCAMAPATATLDGHEDCISTSPA